MKDYFSYNGIGILPKYEPGIPAYGQKGAPGDMGNPGENIYYTSLFLNDNTSRRKGNQLLNEGKELSANDLYDRKTVEYKQGDLVLDAGGNFYIIQKNSENIFNLEKNSMPLDILSNPTIDIDDFKVKCITSFKFKKTSNDASIYDKVVDLDDDSMSWIITKEDGYSYGNHIMFSIVSNFNFDNCVFKYSLILPSGEKLSIDSYDTSAVMFVDNKFIFDSPVDTSSEVLEFNDYKYKIPGEETSQTVSDIIENYGIGSKYISLAASEYMRTYCKATVEITNFNYETTYKFNLDDLFFDEAGEVTDRTGEIIPASISMYWENKTLQENSSTNENVSANQDTYNIDKFKFDFTDIIRKYSKDELLNLCKYNSQSSNYNYIRLWFKQMNSFTILFKYKNLPSGSSLKYPNSAIYIGETNKDLLKRQGNNVTVSYSDKIVPVENKIDTNTNTKEISSGIAQVIINLTEEQKNNEKNFNFIDIAVVSLDDTNHNNDYDISFYIFSIDDNLTKI